MKRFQLLVSLICCIFFSTNSYSQCATSSQPTKSCTSGDMINAFSLNGIPSTGSSNACPSSPAGYNSFLSPVWDLTIGQTYPWTAVTGQNTSFTQGMGIWIDLNNDGFYDVSEFMASTPAAFNHSSTLTIPGTALPAQVRMRVRCDYASQTGATNACTNLSSFGETEDYYVNLISPCAKPTNVAANNITISSATLSWTAVPGSLGYQYRVDQNPGNPVGAGTFTSSTSVNVGGLSIFTQYYFHVRNICSGSESQWVNFPFMTANAYCLPPTQILFANIKDSSAEMMWSKMPTSESYQYMLDITPNAVPTSAKSISTQNFTAKLSNLTPDTWYYVYIRSICLNGTDSSIWKLDSFYTKFFCPAPEVTLTNLGTTTPDASWPAVPNAVSYEYVVTQSANPPSFGAQIFTTNVSLNLPSDNTQQYLHVRTKCNSMFTFSNWTTKQLRTTGINEVQKQHIVFARPNPVRDILTVDIRESLPGEIAITDITGKVLKVQKIEQITTAVDMSNMAPGIYLLRYTNGVTSDVIKINKE